MRTVVLSERLKRSFQILNETDISADYFNEILCIGLPEVITAPNDYYEGGEVEMREKVSPLLKKMPTYSERLRDEVQRQNARSTETIQFSDFVTEKNAEAIRRLDEIVEQIRAMGNVSPSEIDITKLNVLRYEATVIIYGEKEREVAQRRFCVAKY